MRASLIAGLLAATVIAELNLDTLSSPEHNVKDINRRDAINDAVPTLINDNKLGDIYQVTISASNGTIYTTTTTGTSPPIMEPTYDPEDAIADIIGWDKTSELHEQVLKSSNGTVYTTTMVWPVGSVMTFMTEPTPAPARKRSPQPAPALEYSTVN